MNSRQFLQRMLAVAVVSILPHLALAQTTDTPSSDAPAASTTEGAPASDPKAEALAKLSPEQRQKLEAAATQGEEAYLAAVQEIVANMSPEDAASFVQAAIALAGNSSLLKQVGTEGATVVRWLVEEGEPVKQGDPIAILSINGEQVEYRAQADGVMVQQVVPAGQTINTTFLAVIRVSNDNVATAIAAAAAAANPAAAPSIAAAAAAVAPAAAPSIAAAVSAAVPNQAPAVTQSVAQVVPQQAENIASAVTNAVPTADPVTIQNAAQNGAQQSTNDPGSTGSANNTGGVPLPSGGSGGGSGGGSSASR